MHPARSSGERSETFSFEELGAVVTISRRSAGDLRPASPGSETRRQAVLPGPAWSFTKQVHGAVVHQGGREGEPGDGLVDRLESSRPAMFAADCALIGLVSPEGAIGAVHAGWRGLLAGVVEASAAAMRSLGASELAAVRGPVIGPECYEFSRDDLVPLVATYGEAVRGEAASGRPALDLAAAIGAACEQAGIELTAVVDLCTACATDDAGEPLYFSHRARQETGRHALVVSAAG